MKLRSNKLITEMEISEHSLCHPLFCCPCKFLSTVFQFTKFLFNHNRSESIRFFFYLSDNFFLTFRISISLPSPPPSPASFSFFLFYFCCFSIIFYDFSSTSLRIFKIFTLNQLSMPHPVISLQLFQLL